MKASFNPRTRQSPIGLMRSRTIAGKTVVNNLAGVGAGAQSHHGPVHVPPFVEFFNKPRTLYEHFELVIPEVIQLITQDFIFHIPKFYQNNIKVDLPLELPECETKDYVLTLDDQRYIQRFALNLLRF